MVKLVDVGIVTVPVTFRRVVGGMIVVVYVVVPLTTVVVMGVVPLGVEVTVVVNVAVVTGAVAEADAEMDADAEGEAESTTGHLLASRKDSKSLAVSGVHFAWTHDARRLMKPPFSIPQ